MIVPFATLLVGFVFVLIYHLRWRQLSKKVIYVIVLGDIGRSPRMQYHAISLTRLGFRVYLIGFPGQIFFYTNVTLSHLLFIYYDVNYSYFKNIYYYSNRFHYVGSRPHKEILKNELIYVSYLPTFPKVLKGD